MTSGTKVENKNLAFQIKMSTKVRLLLLRGVDISFTASSFLFSFLLIYLLFFVPVVRP